MCAVHNMAVCCSSLISCFPGTLLRYRPSDFKMVPVAPIITGITFVFTFHSRWISIARSWYFRIIIIIIIIIPHSNNNAGQYCRYQTKKQYYWLLAYLGLPLGITTAKHNNNNNNNNNTRSRYCNNRTASTIYNLEIWFVSGICNYKYPA